MSNGAYDRLSHCGGREEVEAGRTQLRGLGHLPSPPLPPLPSGREKGNSGAARAKIGTPPPVRLRWTMGEESLARRSGPGTPRMAVGVTALGCFTVLDEHGHNPDR